MRILLVLLLGGCAVLATPTHLPDGSMGYGINCSGSNWNSCYQKAGELCKERGYEIITGGSEQGHVVAGNQYGMYGGSTTNRTMMIKCK